MYNIFKVTVILVLQIKISFHTFFVSGGGGGGGDVNPIDR
jgi:hypothetical protein